MSGIFQQARSFARHAGELAAHGRRKHERLRLRVETVAKSTNFRPRSALSPLERAAIRPIFVLSATEPHEPRSEAA